MRIVFRADANAVIGSGHLFRCVSLARFARAHGVESAFVSSIGNDELRALVTDNRFEVFDVPSEQTVEQDAATTIAALHPDDRVVTDHARVDDTWERLVRPHVSRIVAIDDRPGRRHDVDALVSTAAFASGGNPFSGFVADGTPVLIGPTFMPLRPEFERVSTHRRVRTHLGVVGAFFGGNDPGDQIARVVEVAARPRWSSVRFMVVCGVLNDRFEEWAEAARRVANLEVLRIAPDMAAFWNDSDVGIGSYGMSAWERCVVGLPTISTVQNDDQVEDARVLAQRGAVIDLGWSAGLTAEALDAALESLAGEPDRLARMSTDAYEVMATRCEDAERLLTLVVGGHDAG